MSIVTKLTYDKTIAEMHSRVHQNRRLELGSESPSLRSSHNGIIFNNDTSSDTDSDGSGGNGSYGSGNRNSFMSISEEGSSPSSMGVGYAFMASARGSRLLQEEELAKISDMAMDTVSDNAVNHHIASLAAERNTRSPSLGKDKRMEYLAKIKNDIITGNTLAHSTTPPPSSPPDNEETWGRRVHRQSFALSQSSDALNLEDRFRDFKDKDKDKDKAKQKKEEKEKLKEEKLRKKQEKKELKTKPKVNTDPPNIATAENSKIMQQLLGIFLLLFSSSPPLSLPFSSSFSSSRSI